MTATAATAGTAGRRTVVFGAALVVLLLTTTIAGSLGARGIVDRDAERVDAERASAAAAALDSAATRAVRGLESLLSLLDTGSRVPDDVFDRFARGTVGAEDFTPTLRLRASARAGGVLRIEHAVMTGRDRALAGRRIGRAPALRRALRAPASSFGVTASPPSQFGGRRGLWLVGPDPSEPLGTGRRFVVVFVRAERFTPPSGVLARVDGRPLAGDPPGEPAIERTFLFAGRRWGVALGPLERPFGSRALPWLILAMGSAFAALVALGAVLARQSQRLERARAEQRVQVMAAAAEERTRLSRDLHDSVSQALFSMTLQARTAELGLEREGIDKDGPVGRPLRELATLTRAALAEIRALIFELRPQALDQEGFVTAVRKHAAALAAREQRTIEVDGPPERVPVAPEAEEHLLRVTLEALNNAVRHAEADHVDVRVLRHGDDGLRIEITDDGRGFDPATRVPGHFGLETMRERVDQIGGTLHISSTPGGGTTVTVDVPPTNRGRATDGRT